jgi:tRNA (guanine37-N1)-methyltransferase
MIFHVVTIFPEFFRGPFEHGVVGRAREAGTIEIRVHDLRTWTTDRHKTVDDRPFGGGEGMLLKAAPIFEAVETILPHRRRQPADGTEAGGVQVILLSARSSIRRAPGSMRD